MAGRQGVVRVRTFCALQHSFLQARTARVGCRMPRLPRFAGDSLGECFEQPFQRHSVHLWDQKASRLRTVSVRVWLVPIWFIPLETPKISTGAYIAGKPCGRTRTDADGRGANQAKVERASSRSENLLYEWVGADTGRGLQAVVAPSARKLSNVQRRRGSAPRNNACPTISGSGLLS